MALMDRAFGHANIGLSGQAQPPATFHTPTDPRRDIDLGR